MLSLSARFRFAAVVASVVIAPMVAEAQVHAHGEVWITRDAAHTTFLHAEGDSLCILEFPAECLGGMMSPDSLYCTLEVMPPEELPDHVPQAFLCHIEDERGHDMMGDGHMTGHGLFRHPLDLTIPYDLAVIQSLGVNPNDLVLLVRQDGSYVPVDDAVHSPASNSFHWTTRRLSSWYGIADGSRLPLAAESTSWGRLKADF